MSTPADTAPGVQVVFGDAGRRAYQALDTEYRATLTGPPDDMWSAFADQAEPAALLVDGELIGTTALDADGELHRYFIRPGFEHHARRALAAVLRARAVRSMIASTADPGAVRVLMPAGNDATPVALLYRHITQPLGNPLDDLIVATHADRERATDFVLAATGDPADFVGPYTAERIERGELMLHIVHDDVVAIGERRFDIRSPGWAHLGIIVGRAHRGHGLGGRVMNSLVEMCERERVTPLCSTTPDNEAAQTLIHRAGFRSRHTVFRLAVRSDVRRTAVARTEGPEPPRI